MTSESEPRPVPSIGTVLSALLQADFAAFRKHRRSLIVSLLLPIFLLVITDRPRAAQTFDGVGYIIGLAISYGLLAMAIVGYALSTSRDRERGVFQRLRVTPAPTWAIMTSRLAVQALANLILALIVVIVGTRIHNLSPSIGQYLLVLLVSALAGGVFLAIAQALVGLIRSTDTLQAVARVLLAALIILGTFGQTGALGSFWQDVSRWSPVGVAMTMYAGVLDVGAWGATDTGAVAAAFGYIVICTAIGVRWFRWDAS